VSDDKYPLHTQLAARSDEQSTIQGFLDFLLDEKGFVLGQYSEFDDEDPTLYQSHLGDVGKAKLIGEFMGIDYNALMAEKDAIYRELAEHASQRSA